MYCSVVGPHYVLGALQVLRGRPRRHGLNSPPQKPSTPNSEPMPLEARNARSFEVGLYFSGLSHGRSPSVLESSDQTSAREKSRGTCMNERDLDDALF